MGGTSIGVINGVGKFAIYISFLLALIVAVTFLETSQRKIPLQQTGKGLSLMHDKESNLPIKVNPAGVVPVIFASAIIALPLMIAAFFPDAWYAKY
ncbi:MAG: hypothetical protein DRP42_01105 [Tenericutes bacterium]|nr:MAG: hypothetical protein DRP42_01105 [Mycoplasmatota bacterium]